MSADPQRVERAAAPPPLRPSILEGALAVALGVVFAPALADMATVWSRVDYYSHGYLVPLVALWAAALRRRALAALPRSRDARGLAVLGAALVLYVIGLVAAWVSLQGVAFVAAVAGLLLFLRGRAWLRALVFPVGFLLFMVPVPETWLQPLIVRLQLFVSALAVAVLGALGAPVTRLGNVIELPGGGGSLFVAEACSGITSLVTLLPLGFVIAYFTERGWLRRGVIVASVLPLALAGNLLRVVVTVLVASQVGVERATSSWLHESAGLLTYVLGCLALLGVGWLLRRVAPPRPPASAASVP